MKTNMIIFFLISILLSAQALALMPPLSDQELEAEATTIVKGEVIAVEKTGKKSQNHCAKMTEHVATLKVAGVKKGNAGDELKIRFEKYDFKGSCVGSADHVHYIGEQGVFYLSCQSDKPCRLVHWNGVKN